MTLLGAGGLGKTRMSLQAAAEVMDDYPDGVWLVELAPVADARMVPQAIASVLGVKEETGRPVLDSAGDGRQDRRLLVILDNCEHLLQACAETSAAALAGGSGDEDPRDEPRAAARGGRDRPIRSPRSRCPIRSRRSRRLP